MQILILFTQVLGMVLVREMVQAGFANQQMPVRIGKLDLLLIILNGKVGSHTMLRLINPILII